MEDKIKEVFLKYSKSVDTEYNVYNCLIEEDWHNIAHEIVKLFAIPVVVGQSEQLLAFAKHLCPKEDVALLMNDISVFLNESK